MRRLTATDLAARPLMQLPHKANSGSAWDASGGEGRVLFTKQFGPGQRDKRLLFPATAMQQLGVTRTVVSDGPARSPDVCRAVSFQFFPLQTHHCIRENLARCAMQTQSTAALLASRFITVAPITHGAPQRGPANC